jgi:aryl-alcohol dehydrogenase-like predicted oxidoreductase
MSGLLSGKYNSGEIPEGSRFAVEKWLGEDFEKYFGEGRKEKTMTMFATIKGIAAELECT